MNGLVNKHRFLDRVTTATGIIGPIMTIPQLYQIYGLHLASGVSPISWLAFGILDIPFIIYGVVHKDPPIITTYILWFLANILVGVGAIVYR